MNCNVVPWIYGSSPSSVWAAASAFCRYSGWGSQPWTPLRRAPAPPLGPSWWVMLNPRDVFWLSLDNPTIFFPWHWMPTFSICLRFFLVLIQCPAWEHMLALNFLIFFKFVQMLQQACLVWRGAEKHRSEYAKLAQRVQEEHNRLLFVLENWKFRKYVFEISENISTLESRRFV